MCSNPKYRSISLRYDTYSELEGLSHNMVEGLKLSNAKTVEKLIKEKKEEVSNAGSMTKITNKDITYEKKEKTKN